MRGRLRVRALAALFLIRQTPSTFSAARPQISISLTKINKLSQNSTAKSHHLAPKHERILKIIRRKSPLASAQDKIQALISSSAKHLIFIVRGFVRGSCKCRASLETRLPAKLDAQNGSEVLHVRAANGILALDARLEVRMVIGIR
jgi:hypothetical protein